MEAKLSRTWQDSYERWKAPVAIGVVVVAFVLGLVGWRLTDETLGVGDVLYNTLAMFALNFGHDGPIHWVLDVARFLAAVVVYWAAFAVAIKVISRGSPVRRAAKLKRHVVLMGDTDEVAPIAGRYRDAGREVVVVWALRTSSSCADATSWSCPWNPRTTCRPATCVGSSVVPRGWWWWETMRRRRGWRPVCGTGAL